MSRYKIERQILFDSRKTLKDIDNFFLQYPELDLIKIRDQKQNTALHQCSFQNRKPFMQKFLTYANNFENLKYGNVNRIRQWVNSKNSEGFTAMHYAAYKGLTQILEYLRRNGGDSGMETTSGHNMLHLAAQGDKVETFVYFRDQFDINSLDSKGGSALHWASYIGSQKVVQYLLAQNTQIKLNQKDNEGQTPLHLATAYGNTRIVRKLLLAGAQRNITNNKGQLPKDIAKENQFSTILKMLDNKYSCLDYVKFYCNVKIKYEPQNRSPLMPCLFVFSYIILVFSCFLQVTFEQKIIEYSIIGIYALNLLLYFSLIVGPTKPQCQTYEKFIKMNLPNGLDSVCMFCVNSKPERGYHCDICHICIEQYDHHCPWINNCVGKRNIARFIIFLFFLEIGFIGIGVLNGFILYITISNQQLYDNGWIKFRDIFGLQGQELNIMHYTFSGVNLLVFLCFFLPILLLLFVQTKNLLLNQTTYQRFSNNSRRSILSQSNSSIRVQHYRRQRHKKNKVSLRNCKNMCFGSRNFKNSLATDDSLMQPLANGQGSS